MDITVKMLREMMARNDVLGKEIPVIVRCTETYFNVFIDEEDVFLGFDVLKTLHLALPGHEIRVGTIPRKVREGMIDNLVIQVGRKATQPW